MKRAIRAMNKSDLSLVIEIESRAFTHPWPAKAFEDILSMRPWVLEVNEQVCGYICYHSVLDEAVIINFAIDSDYRRMGHGDYLLGQSIAILTKEGISHFYLDVRKGNSAALNLYSKHGFIPLGIRRQYYCNPDEDAIVMGLILPLMNQERDT